jgi:kynurenine formamidase
MVLKVIDLSMEIKTGSPVFPGYPTPIVHPWTTIREHGYYSNILQFVEHTATHVDAPAHFIEGAPTIDAVPLERFMGRGIVVDASHLPPKASITREFLEKALSGRSVGRGWIVLIMTSYDRKAGTPEWFNHPGLDESGARYLAELDVNAVGIDAPSIDHEPFPAHRILLQKGIVIFENLTNLELVKGREFMFYAFPLKIVKGSASPVRAVAIIEE